MPEPEDDRAARPASDGRLRASRADREHVIDALKDAFVEDRLTKDEFDSRVSHALASRTHADLAALTADLPTPGPPAAQPRRQPIQPRPRRPKNTTVRVGACVIAAATVLTGAVWAGVLASNTDNQVAAALVLSCTLLWIGIVFLVGAIMLESRLHQRSDRQLPPAPGQGAPRLSPS